MTSLACWWSPSVASPVLLPTTASWQETICPANEQTSKRSTSTQSKLLVWFLQQWMTNVKKVKNKSTKYSSLQQLASPLRELTRHMRSHSVTCRPTEVAFPPLPQPTEDSTWFSDPGGMQGWVDLVGLITYQGGIPTQRRSPIPVPNWFNVE